MPEASDGPPSVTEQGKSESLAQSIVSLTRTLIAEDDPPRGEGGRMDALDFKDRAQNIDLKKRYGGWLLWTLIGQLVITNLAFLAVGIKWLTYPDSTTIQVFVGATMIEVAILIRMILKSLFPEKKS